jgi:hypothetical protein
MSKFSFELRMRCYCPSCGISFNAIQRVTPTERPFLYEMITETVERLQHARCDKCEKPPELLPLELFEQSPVKKKTKRKRHDRRT